MPKGACILYLGRTHCIHCEKCAEFRASVRAYGREQSGSSLRSRSKKPTKSLQLVFRMVRLQKPKRIFGLILSEGQVAQ